jgi:hypothetical protein
MSQGGKRRQEEEAGIRNSSTDSVNSGSGPDYQTCTALGCGPLITNSGLTESVFRLDRLMSSSFDFPEKIPVDSNTSCFTCFVLLAAHPKLQIFF